MFRRIEDFLKVWTEESANTCKIFAALTDESLGQAVADGHRTLGRMAWHITLTLGEMIARTGLQVDAPPEDAPVPAASEEIFRAYSSASDAIAKAVQSEWTDETLDVEDDMYGETWKRGFTLFVLVTHEVHHRGQMTVLMRQAGLPVPGVYGPSKEEWVNYGADPPEV
ncbi:MAG: DinB family protein [bacterium]|jgi:uncharacterized damage-inducible protein DinB